MRFGQARFELERTSTGRQSRIADVAGRYRLYQRRPTERRVGFRDSRPCRRKAWIDVDSPAEKLDASGDGIRIPLGEQVPAVQV